MARLVGPDEGSRLVYGIRADNALTTGGAMTATVYADAAGTILADILTYPGGVAVPGSVLAVGSDSLLPLFQFPDGVDTVYVSASGGPVTPVYARPVRSVAGRNGAVTLTGADVPESLGPTIRMPQYLAPSSVVTSAGWGGSGGVVTADTTDFVVGTSSAKITSAGAGGTFRISKGSLSLDTTGKQLRVWLKCDDTTFVGAGGITFAIANDSGFAASYNWQIWLPATGSDYVTSGDWVQIVLNFASATTTGAPTRTGITDVKATIADGNTAHPVTLHLQTNDVELIPEPSIWPNGLVSICFDDCWQSGYDFGKTYMDTKSMQGSIYVIGDMVGASQRLTQAELLTMQSQGWDIGGHANTDADHVLAYTGMTAAQLDADLRAQKATLVRLGFAGADGTAYPLGAYGRTTDGQPTIPITRKYFSYARTTAAGSSRTREAWPPADPMRLRAISSISTFSGGYAPSSITATTTGDLDKTKANKGWLILIFHKIVTGALASTTEIAQSDFQAIIDKIAANSMACLPIGTALRYYG